MKYITAKVTIAALSNSRAPNAALPATTPNPLEVLFEPRDEPFTTGQNKCRHSNRRL